MSALLPKADINYRERDSGFVPSCSVDDLARDTERLHERSSLLGHRLPPDRLHKKSILCTKSSPLLGLYVQSPALRRRLTHIASVGQTRPVGEHL